MTDTSAEAVDRIANEIERRAAGAKFMTDAESWREDAATLRALAAERDAFRAENERLRDMLRLIFEADDVELALDPTWPKSVARAALRQEC